MKYKSAAYPYMIWIVIFVLVPLALVGYFAITDASGNYTLSNISRVGEFSAVVLRSIWLALVATVICLLVAYPMAFILSRYTERVQQTMLTLTMLPMWMNFLLRTYALMTILENNGLINRFLGLFGIAPLHLINTQGAIVLGMVYNYLPFMILPLYSIMTKIDNSIIHAAQDLGANMKTVLRHVIIPLSMPGITTGITMVFVPSVSTFAISRMLGGGTNLMIGDLIDIQFLGVGYNINLGAAISLVLMVLILLAMSITNQFDGEDKEGMII